MTTAPQPLPGRPNPDGVDPLLPLFLDVLRARGHVTFMLSESIGDHCGLAELDQSVIVLNERNDTATQRATICHELLHLDCGECPEDQVEQMAAEILVPLHDALAARAHTGANLATVAARLGVDPQLVRARIRSLPSGSEAADGVG